MVSSTVFKSALKAYQNVMRNKAGGAPKQEGAFKEYFDKMMQATNIQTKAMTRSEAVKVLNLKEEEPLDPEVVMETFMRLTKANDPTKGGSFYMQSKIHCAKEEVMKDFPGAEKEFYDKYDPDLENEAEEKTETDNAQKSEKEQEATEKEEQPEQKAETQDKKP